MNQTMQAIHVTGYEGITSLRVGEAPVPVISNNEVLIRVSCSSINPSDLLFIEGNYGVKLPLPCIGGIEGSGTVVEAGNSLFARRLKGKRVAFAGAACGAWAEYIKVDAMACMPLPKGVSDEQGAVFFVNPLSAIAILRTAQKHKSPAVVHTAGASAVGKLLVRIAPHMGVQVISVVRRESQAETLRGLGAVHVVNSESADFDAELRRLASELKAAVSFDAVGGSLAGRVLTAMPDGSTLYQYGLLSADPVTTADADQIVFHRKSVRGFWAVDWVKEQSIFSMLSLQSAMNKWIGSEIQTDISRTYPLSQAMEAIAYYEANMSAGKVLLVPGR
ncbi:zinc-binding dehydrogenase [Paenibacillus gansuensis]|uniref:Zinc-binding dehydrogenase n=1 Tax=Paenibacillus gansuensis TaxID=306542 RepID=A0ABW5PGA6_9BACL